MTSFLTRSARETVELGRSFAQNLKPGDIVALSGNLGSGKTSFVTGVCEGLGASIRATSPTFTLINEYAAPFGTVVHIDLYRIGSRSELAELGIEEYFNERCICLIEWAECVLDMLPDDYYLVKVTYGPADTEREISIENARGMMGDGKRPAV